MKKGWETKKLEDIYDVKSCKRVHKSDWQKTGIPFYRAREVVKLAKYGFVENELFISEQLFNEFTKTKGFPVEGDIVVSAVGTLGECYLVRENDKFYIKDASVLWLSKKSDIFSRYIEYSFKSKLVKNQILNKSMGATVGTLTINRAKNIEIPIPPLSEQRRIVAILDKAFAAIDKAKENAEQNLKNAKEVFESYLQSVFENKGDDWEEKSLDEVVDTRCSLSYGIVQPGDDVSNGIPIVRPTDMKNKYINFEKLKKIDPIKSDSYKRTLLHGYELLICVRGKTGVISLINETFKGANVTRGIVPICFNKEIINRKFGYYLFLSNEIQKQIKEKTYGTALMQINIRDLRKLIIRFPSVIEQEVVINKLDELSDKTKKLESIYQHKLENLEELKKSILQKAFRGEL